MERIPLSGCARSTAMLAPRLDEAAASEGSLIEKYNLFIEIPYIQKEVAK